jgi:hypothetical protein
MQEQCPIVFSTECRHVLVARSFAMNTFPPHTHAVLCQATKLDWHAGPFLTEVVKVGRGNCTWSCSSTLHMLECERERFANFYTITLGTVQSQLFPPVSSSLSEYNVRGPQVLY